MPVAILGSLKDIDTRNTLNSGGGKKGSGCKIDSADGVNESGEIHLRRHSGAQRSRPD